MVIPKAVIQRQDIPQIQPCARPQLPAAYASLDEARAAAFELAGWGACNEAMIGAANQLLKDRAALPLP
ncbi:hypothetical protein [Ferrovibrio xuzhouensis]|uniref:Uncharacterized protein n=1 Tax=Ferrovibrio xuzhouensis TaxID=1576914 RepID=A0ABV7VC56_9PROT